MTGVVEEALSRYGGIVIPAFTIVFITKAGSGWEGAA